MHIRHKPWTLADLNEEMSKYSSRRAFALANSWAYRKALKLGIISAIPKKSLRWNKEAVIKEAANFESRTDFYRGMVGAYRYALKNRMLDFMPAKIGEADVYRLSVPLDQIKSDTHRVICGHFLSRMKRGDIARKVLAEGTLNKCSNKSTVYMLLRRYTTSIVIKRD